MRPLAVALMGLVVLAAAGCGGDSDDLEVDSIDAAALLELAAERMEAVDAFRFKFDQENGTSEIVQGIRMESAAGSVAGPDRLEVEIEGSFLALSVKVGVVILPDESFLRNPITGNWERESVNIDAFFDPANGVTALMRAIEGAVVIGSRTLDGVAVVELEATIDSGALTLFGDAAVPGELVTAEVWIGADDPLVYLIEVTGAVLSGDADNMKRRLALSDFDGDIVIEAPR